MGATDNVGIPVVGKYSGSHPKRKSYFADLTFKDPIVRELVSGIESILASPQADFKLREDILQKVAEMIGNAIQARLIRPRDYKPRLFRGTAYEQYQKRNLWDKSREYKLDIRV